MFRTIFTTLWPLWNLEIFGTELAVLAETLSYTMSKKTERYKVKRGSISVKLSPWPKIWEHMIKADPWSLPLPPSLTFHTCKSNIHILSCLKKCTTHKISNVQRYLRNTKWKRQSMSVKLSPWPKIGEQMIKATPTSEPSHHRLPIHFTRATLIFAFYRVSKKCTTVTILPPPLLVHHPNILD